MTRRPSIVYLCLQVTREGQASHAHVREIVSGLESRGFSVTLFEPDYGARAVLPGAVGRALEFLRVQRRLARWAGDCDLLYVRAHFAAAPTALWGRRHGIPVVQEVNGSYEDLFAAWPWTRRLSGLFIGLMRNQYRRADALITVTEPLADWLAHETGRSDVHVIPNGANIRLFHPGARRYRGLPSKYVVFFGAFAPWQGIGTLLAAVEDPVWPSNTHLVLAGDGARRPEVEEAAKRNPLVIYLGPVAYADMPGLVAGSIAGLSPQGRGGGRSLLGLSPLKVYEAMACGVPVIATDFPGQAELVRDGDAGLVIPPADASALAAAVAALVANPEQAREMGARGRRLVVGEHSWEARVEAMDRVLTGVVDGGGPVS